MIGYEDTGWGQADNVRVRGDAYEKAQKQGEHFVAASVVPVAEVDVF